MRRALCTIGSGPHAELLALTGPTFAEFASHHDYELHFYDTNPTPDRPASWGRIPILRHLLTEYDEVLWIDADAVIVDSSLDIADVLGPDDLMGMTAHVTPEGDVPIPNCGVWLVRSDPATLDFLDAVWDSTAYIDHKWWENAAVLVTLGYGLEPRVHLERPAPLWFRTRLLSSEWNSVPVDPSPTPRIVHFPGMTHEERLVGIHDAIATIRDR